MGKVTSEISFNNISNFGMFADPAGLLAPAAWGSHLEEGATRITKNLIEFADTFNGENRIYYILYGNFPLKSDGKIDWANKNLAFTGHKSWMAGEATGFRYTFSDIKKFNGKPPGEFCKFLYRSNDELYGSDMDDQIHGYNGNDIIATKDGSDLLIGGAGADILTGGSGADIFAYTSLSDSTVAAKGRDTIVDFNGVDGDRVDLSALDANKKVAGDQAFAFVANNAFSGRSGELRFANGVLSGDVNGDKKADFAIAFSNLSTFDASWAIL